MLSPFHPFKNTLSQSLLSGMCLSPLPPTLMDEGTLLWKEIYRAAKGGQTYGNGFLGQSQQ